MSRIIKPRQWNVRPALVAPKWKWFWDSATLVSLFWDKIGGPLLTGQTDWIENGTGNNTLVANSHGSAVDFDNIGRMLYRVGDASWLPRGTHGTFLCVRRKTDATARSSNLFKQSAAGTSTAQGYVPHSDGNIFFEWGGAGGNFRATWGGYTNNQQVEMWAFTAGPSGLKIYFDGLLRATQATAASRGPSDAGQFWLNRRTSTGDLIEINLFVALDAELTAAQVAQWSNDPFGPFRYDDSLDATVVYALAAEEAATQWIDGGGIGSRMMKPRMWAIR